MIQAAHLAGVAFHHGIAQCDLAVSADDDMIPATNGEDGGASILIHVVLLRLNFWCWIVPQSCGIEKKT